MRLAFDTNILIEIDLLNQKLTERLKELRKKAPASPTIPSPVVSEYYYGFLGIEKPDIALKNLEIYEILNTSKQSSFIFAEIKHELTTTGRLVPDMDMLIASICMAHDATLVTFDAQFESVQRLKKIILSFDHQ